jgi:hypothetical protein
LPGVRHAQQRSRRPPGRREDEHQHDDAERCGARSRRRPTRSSRCRRRPQRTSEAVRSTRPATIRDGQRGRSQVGGRPPRPSRAWTTDPRGGGCGGARVAPHLVCRSGPGRVRRRARRRVGALEALLGRASRPRRLSGPEVDELVDLYQRTATTCRSCRAPAPTRCSSPGSARWSPAPGRGRRRPARAVVDVASSCAPTSRRSSTGPGGGRSAHRVLPRRRLRARRLDRRQPAAQLAVAPPEVVQQLVTEDFEDYYSSNPRRTSRPGLHQQRLRRRAVDPVRGPARACRCCTCCSPTP